MIKRSIIICKATELVFTTTKRIDDNMKPFSHARTLKTAHKLKLGPREKYVFLRVLSSCDAMRMCFPGLKSLGC